MKIRHALSSLIGVLAGALLAASPVVAQTTNATQNVSEAVNSDHVTFRGLTGDARIVPNNPPDDQALASAVRQALAADPYVAHVDVGVTVHRGVAYLSKTVDTPFDRSRVELVAARVPDIVDVDSHIAVEQPGPQSDDELAAAVRDEIYWNPALDLRAISVRVNRGHVTLTGVVDSWRKRGTITDEAMSAGAADVQNDVRVETAASTSEGQ
jgi:osmotically-inducible protein OsmY